jgi:hypothetical protein
LVCNGLPNPLVAERRLVEVTDAVYTALGDVAAHLRRPLTGVGRSATLST